jgi:hypothetical protein
MYDIYDEYPPPPPPPPLFFLKIVKVRVRV